MEQNNTILSATTNWIDFDDTAYDCNGKEIHEGDIVIWTDPDGGRRVKYEVYGTPTSDMVSLWSKHGECEAFPDECKVVGHRK